MPAAVQFSAARASEYGVASVVAVKFPFWPYRQVGSLPQVQLQLHVHMGLHTVAVVGTDSAVIAVASVEKAAFSSTSPCRSSARVWQTGDDKIFASNGPSKYLLALDIQRCVESLRVSTSVTSSIEVAEG